MKSLKSLEAGFRRPKNQTNISFNKSSFNLGNLTVITDQLQKQTRDFLIEEYKNNHFQKEIDKQKLLNDPMDTKKKYIILSEPHAKEIIKEILLKPLEQTMESLEIKNEVLLQFDPIISQAEPSAYKKIKNQFRLDRTSLINKITNENLTMKKQKLHSEQTMKDIIESACLKVDRQLFIRSIVMIIEKQPNSEDKSQGVPIKSVTVFEQSYPCKEFDKVELQTIIGNANYQRKLMAAVKIYHFSINNPDFNNPLFRTCHQCRRVQGIIHYPQNIICCPKKLQQGQMKHIKSEFVFSPFSYLKRMIQKDHFNCQDEPFTHPYIQYHRSSSSHQNKAICDRQWCPDCVISGKKNIKQKQCEFCDFACNCTRCKIFEKLMKLLAHYFNSGGDYSQIKPKLLFNQVFDCQHSNYEPKRKNSSFQKFQFPFIEELKATYYANKPNFEKTKKWNKLHNSRLVSCSIPQTQRQFQILQTYLENDRMQIKKNPDQVKTGQNRKNKKKIHGSIKAQNIEGKINNLSQQTKKMFIETAKQQQKILTAQLIRSGILKSNNPLSHTHDKKKQKKDKEIVIQQTQLQKQERKFYSKVSFIESKILEKEVQSKFSALVESQMVSKERKNLKNEKKID